MNEAYWLVTFRVFVGGIAVGFPPIISPSRYITECTDAGTWAISSPYLSGRGFLNTLIFSLGIKRP